MPPSLYRAEFSPGNSLVSGLWGSPIRVTRSGASNGPNDARVAETERLNGAGVDQRLLEHCRGDPGELSVQVRRPLELPLGEARSKRVAQGGEPVQTEMLRFPLPAQPARRYLCRAGFPPLFCFGRRRLLALRSIAMDGVAQ